MRQIITITIHWTRYLFSDWQKRAVNFRNQRLWRHIAADYRIIITRTLKVTGNHVMYDRRVWFQRIILSSSRALCCLPSVEITKTRLPFFFVQCIIKQLLYSVFAISRIMKVSVRVISLSLRLIALTSTFIIVDYFDYCVKTLLQ